MSVTTVGTTSPTPPMLQPFRPSSKPASRSGGSAGGSSAGGSSAGGSSAGGSSAGGSSAGGSSGPDSSGGDSGSIGTTWVRGGSELDPGGFGCVSGCGSGSRTAGAGATGSGQ